MTMVGQRNILNFDQRDQEISMALAFADADAIWAIVSGCRGYKDNSFRR